MANSVNPQMIVVAREARQMSQAALAKAANIPQARLSRSEAGLVDLDENQVSSIARELDFPVDFFRQSDRVFGFGSSCFFHRKRSRMAIGDLRAIQARLNIFRFQLTRLLRGVEIESENGFIRMDVEDCGTPSTIAREVRRLWNLPLGPVENVVAAVEHAGAIVYSLDFGTRDLDAISQVAPACPPVIFINNRIPGDRLRFTLMHEVGHLIMHHLPSQNAEAEADEFASEFLMPSVEIKSELRQLSLLRLPPLKERWRVSMQALVRKARDLDQISDRQYRSLFTRMSMKGWRTEEPVEISREEPTVFDDILRAYSVDQQLSMEEISKIANANPSRFKNHWRDEPNNGLRVHCG